MARRRAPGGFTAADVPLVRAALVERAVELGDYYAAVGIEAPRPDRRRPRPFYGWQLPPDLRRGLPPGARCVLHRNAVEVVAT